MTNEPPIDPVSVIVTLISIAGVDAMAQVLGPYVVIAAAGLGGAGFGAMRWRKSTRWEVTLYVLGFSFMSLMLTVPLTELSMRFMPAAWHIEGRWLLAPMAALIAGIGHDWPSVITWGITRLDRAIEAGKDKKADPQP